MNDVDDNIIVMAEKLTCCSHCLRVTDELKWCGNCRGVKYCSAECQKAAWSVHKLNCRPEDFDINKEHHMVIRKTLAKKRIKTFLIVCYHHCSLLGWKYLQVEFVTDKQIRCYGTNVCNETTNTGNKVTRWIVVFAPIELHLNFDFNSIAINELYSEYKHLFILDRTMTVTIELSTMRVTVKNGSEEIVRTSSL